MLKLASDYRKKIAPYRTFFTWDITYKCNYRCSYCSFNEHDGWKEPNVTVSPGTEKWLRIWQDIYNRYGSCEIHFAGGEPFVYPDFMNLIEKISEIHTMEFSTNLYWDPEDFIKRIKPGRARIGVSFHPEFISFERFFEKVQKIKNAGFEIWANYVGYPPIFTGMSEYKQRFEQIGVFMNVLPFKGEYEGRKYPDGYTEQEKEYLKEVGNYSWTEKNMEFAFNREKRDRRNKLCRMGQMYAKVHANGDAFSCCAKSAKKLGNLIDGTFSFLEEPFICADDNCPCWRGMIIGEEAYWLEHWVTPLDAREIMDRYRRDEKGVYSKIKVALVQAPVWGIFDPPVGLAQLSSCLKEKGIPVNVFDLNIELYRSRKEEYKNAWAIEQSSFWCNQQNTSEFFLNNRELTEGLVNKLISCDADIIAFSINNSSLYPTLELARRIKRKRPETKIILGGPLFFVTVDIESIMSDDYVDIVVLGEGEETFCELIEILNKNKDLNLCKGIIYKKENQLVRTQTRPLIKNLDALPFLDFTDLPLDRYDPPGHLGKHISLMTSRGCIQNCVFCGPRAYWLGYRSMSGKRIYEEIKCHLERNPKIEHIEFLDLLFNGNMKTLNGFCDLMISEPIKPGLKWHANVVVRPEMTLDTLLKMRKAGCIHLTYGIESGSRRILGLMHKLYRIEDADCVLRNTHEAGIELTCNFMFGFPGETEEDFQQTLDFLKRNSKYINIAYPSTSCCTIEPFSYLAEHMDDFGVIPNNINNLYWDSVDGENNYPERLRRYQEFSKLASQLGVSVGLGLQTSIELDRFYNLSFYYESKKDFENAKTCLKEYLKLDPKNTVINKKLQELEITDTDSTKEIKINLREGHSTLDVCNNAGKSRDSGRISFNWDISSVCNYRCPYCWFYGRWAEIKNRNLNVPIFRLEEFWKRIYENYGRVNIAITGGEPFLFPEFTDLITRLTDWHNIEIVTNLSCSVNSFIDKFKSANIKIHPSFHPLFADFEQFVEKLIVLREKGLANNCSYVAWPPQIPLIEYYAKKFKEYKIEMFVQSFFGEYKGMRYPDRYSDAQRKIILPYIGERGGEPFQTSEHHTKGKLCYAGCLYGVIHPDGTVLRCGGVHSEDARVGNMLDKDFKLFTDAYPCTSQTCPCNEWAFLLKEK